VESFNYKVGVYQYECSSPVLAPVGCLQYFLSVTGVVESFNYKVGVSAKLPQPEVPPQLNPTPSTDILGAKARDHNNLGRREMHKSVGPLSQNLCKWVQVVSLAA
jgi:hypothetical protein